MATITSVTCLLYPSYPHTSSPSTTLFSEQGIRYVLLAQIIQSQVTHASSGDTLQLFVIRKTTPQGRMV